MARHPRKRTRSVRRSSVVGPVAVGGASFALLLGALFYLADWSSPSDSAETDASAAAAAPEPSSPTTSQSATPTPQSTSPEKRNEKGAQPGKPAAVADRQSEPASEPSPEDEPAPQPTPRSLEDRVKAHLEAGEFAPAVELAESADEPEQTRLLNLIIDAQIEAGEFEAAQRTASRLSLPRRRGQVENRTGRSRDRTSLSGGAMADFGPLIELIQTNTSGEWEEETGSGGTMTEFNQGVHVDPNGLLRHLTREELDGRLKSLGIRARKAALNEDMAQSSPLRLVSLTRLERAVADRLAEGQPVLSSMAHLAGLTQVQYVFVYPESGEIVIGGPAEGWRYTERGVPVGVHSDRPTLQLDDLVTVLRTFSPQGRGEFRCSINPRPEGLKRVKRFVAQSHQRGPLRPGTVSSWVRRLQELLGLQDVVIEGIPKTSRVARVIVDADYRMKLIGIGEVDGGPDIPSYFDLLPVKLQKNAPNLSALRWWLTMKYDAVLHSPQRDVFEIRGSSVLCRSENEFINDQGQQVHTGKAEATNRRFARNFTEHYAQLADRDPVFADLQNVFDLSLVAALMRHDGLAERTGWNLGVFAPGGAYQPAEFEPPETVMSAVNHRVYNGRDIVVQVAGGVRADLMAVVTDEALVRESSRLAGFAEQGRAPQLPEGRWWWDAPLQD